MRSRGKQGRCSAPFSSKRKSGVQLPIPFARSTPPTQPPLARIFGKGRGAPQVVPVHHADRGGWRARDLPTHLGISMRCHPWTRGPGWQGCPADLRGIDLAWTGGLPQAIEEARPAAHNRTAQRAGRQHQVREAPGRYVTVPVGLWVSGRLAVLSARAVTLLIILSDPQGGVDPSTPPSLGTGQAYRYGISQDTWTLP